MRAVKSFDDALAFRPVRLPTARAAISKLHTATASRPRELAPHQISEIRARIERAASAEDPGRALQKLARSLIPLELVTAVRAIGRWRKLRGAVAAIARERPLPAYVAALWKVWQEYPRSAQVTKLLVETGRGFGMETAVGERYHQDAIEWFRESTPVDSMVHWTGQRDIGWRELDTIAESPFRSGTPLVVFVFHRTLQIGSTPQLLRLATDDVLGGWGELSGADHMDACANFLVRIGPDHWHDRGSILGEIRRNYGLPGAEGSLAVFWARVPQERRGDFREYFITQVLDRAFRGDSDRHRFWMAERREMLDACTGKAGKTEWALIDFRGFSVVEFFEVGNAAYLYPADEPMVHHIRTRKRASFPSELKKIIRYAVPGYTDNRIIHGHDWQYSAKQILHAWKERYS